MAVGIRDRTLAAGHYRSMQFQPFEPDIEVNGQTVYAVVDGFRLFRRLASEILQQEGIGRVKADGDLILDRHGWYPQAAWLRAFSRIADEAGSGALFAIGRQIPENARFPPGVVDILSAIQAIDVGYHLNHRKRGQVMFDPETNTKLAGIGSYGCRVEQPRRIVSECSNPYPCDFDRGILSSMARTFEPQAQVVHDDAKPCRKRDADSCTYVITW
jgi:hypothetical protein